MKRLLTSCVLALPLVALTIGPARAEVKTRDKTQVKLDLFGPFGGLIGGKAAKEGIVSSHAVKGNRKATMNDSGGQIVDLSEEKIYQLDVKKKTYTVKTFAEVREELRKAREDAEKRAREQEGQSQKTDPQRKPDKEFEFDFDVKETGQKKSIAGYDTREVIMTLSMREKGKTLEENGGFVMTADSWVGPDIPALKEMADFELRYWKQLAGSEGMGMSPDQMAMVLVQYPIFKEAMERLKKEGSKLQGAPLASTITFDAVKSKEQMAAQTESSKSSGGSGLGGMLARKIAKQDGAPKQRSTVFTVNSETLEVATTVAATDLDIPAGFKEKK